MGNKIQYEKNDITWQVQKTGSSHKLDPDQVLKNISQLQSIQELKKHNMPEEKLVLEEEHFSKIVDVLNMIDQVRDRLELYPTKEMDLSKVYFELGRSYAELCKAYDTLDSVADDLNPSWELEEDQD